MTTIVAAPADSDRTPVVRVHDGRLMANSRDVAAFFGRQHKDVLRAIDNLECSSDFTGRNFALSPYTDPTGRSLRSFGLARLAQELPPIVRLID